MSRILDALDALIDEMASETEDFSAPFGTTERLVPKDNPLIQKAFGTVGTVGTENNSPIPNYEKNHAGARSSGGARVEALIGNGPESAESAERVHKHHLNQGLSFRHLSTQGAEKVPNGAENARGQSETYRVEQLASCAEISRLRAPTPADEWSANAWRQMQTDLAAFLAVWGEMAKRLGWTDRELFALPARHQFAAYGLVPTLAGKRVVVMDAEKAIIEVVRSGVRQGFRRHSCRAKFHIAMKDPA